METPKSTEQRLPMDRVWLITSCAGEPNNNRICFHTRLVSVHLIVARCTPELPLVISQLIFIICILFIANLTHYESYS